MTYSQIFFRPNDSQVLDQYSRTDYASEEVLQKALADAPEVIAGFTTTSNESARLMLIKREMQVNAPGVAGTFSLDHLYVDSAGVPVLVEVKRSSDTRSRREVVAQMLDYAANAAQWWTPEVIRGALELRAGDEKLVHGLLSEQGIEMDEEDLVSEVVNNLNDGNIRLVFVADKIPESLQRIIEFLNAQMTPAEVLGVEVQQYEGPAGTVFVPRLVGSTTAAKDKKLAASGGQQWDKDLFLDAAKGRCPNEELQVILELLEKLQKQGGEAQWGKGAQPGFGARYNVNGEAVALWNLRAPYKNRKARVEFRLVDLLAKGAIEERANVAKEKLAKIPGAKTDGGYLSLYLSQVVNSPEKGYLFSAIDTLAGASTNQLTDLDGR